MKRPEIIRTLKAHEAELKRRGVERAALFGSVARGEGSVDSDIDVMLERDPAARVTAFEYAVIVEYVRDLSGGKENVANRETLNQAPPPVGRKRDAIVPSMSVHRASYFF